MIPQNPSELSVEFLSSIMGKPVCSFVVEETQIQGNCSSVHRATINYTNSLTFPAETVYLKFALSPEVNNGPVNRDFLVKTGAYKKEIAFYKYLKEYEHSLLDIVPPIYYAEIDHENNDQFLLIMGAGGVAMDQLKSCSIDFSRAVITQLARFQSRFINAEDLLRERNLSVCLSPSHYILSVITGQDASSTAELIQDFCVEHFASKFNDFAQVLEAIDYSESTHTEGEEMNLNTLKPLLQLVREEILNENVTMLLKRAFHVAFIAPTFKTLIHGDFRPDNMLQHGDSCKFIDFQAMCYGHPVYDVAQFLYQSHQNLTEDVLEELVTIYYNTLRENNPGEMSSQATTTLPLLISNVKSASIFQVLLLAFYLAPMKAAIDAETGKLPKSMNRYFDVIILISFRGLRAFERYCCGIMDS